MVRGLAALLGGAAYLELADAVLPRVGGTTGVLLAGCFGALAVALVAYAPLAGRDGPVALGVFGVGAALLAVALNGRDVASGATPVEALFGAAAGLLFAYGFAVPALVVALPVLVAGIDAASLVGGTDPLVTAPRAPDLLTLDLPAWGGDGPVPRPALLDAVVLALLASWSVRYALRPRIALPLMAVLFAASVGLSVAVDRALPVLCFLAAGFLAPALDRLPALLRAEG